MARRSLGVERLAQIQQAIQDSLTLQLRAPPRGRALHCGARAGDVPKGQAAAH